MTASRLFVSIASLALLAGAYACGGSSGSPSGLASSSGSSGGTGPSVAGLDGTWDVTSAGGDPVGASEITVANGAVQGYVARSEEGQPDGACTRTKDRIEVNIAIQGDGVSGTFTDVQEWTGTACPKNRSEATAFAGKRTKPATTTGAYDGEWEVQFGGDPPFVVTIDGLTAKAGDKRKLATGAQPNVQMVVAGGIATLSSDKRSFAFAAKKR